MADRCTLTDLRPADCAHCRKVPDPFAEPASERATGVLGSWFPARYAGTCDECGTEFEVGEQIRSDGERGWVGECCGEED